MFSTTNKRKRMRASRKPVVLYDFLSYSNLLLEHMLMKNGLNQQPRHSIKLAHHKRSQISSLVHLSVFYNVSSQSKLR